VQILAALFIESIDVRQVEGPSTRLDLTGAHFSAVAPQEPPLTWAPHLVVIVHRPAEHDATATLEVIYRRDGEQIARNVQLLEVEPGRFTYRLVRGELDFDDYGTIEAHCRLADGPVTVVPFTLLEPAGG
jgi:hypothetical protein